MIMSSDYVFEFLHLKLKSNSFAAFKEMRESGQHIDVIIKAGDQIFPAHRLVLSAAIPYFRAMFGSNMAESNMREIPIKEIDPVALGCLIDFVYTSRLKVTSENVESLIKASEFLQFAEVKDGCFQYLSEHLTPSNVLEVQALAEGWNCQSLVDSTNTYIRKNFENFCQENEFLSLPFSFVNDLIRRDDLRVASEEFVFEAVLKWVKADPERRALLPELLTGVRMTLLTSEYLVKKVSNEELIRQSIPCRDFVDEAKHCRMLPNDALVCCSFIKKERTCNEKKEETHSTALFKAPSLYKRFRQGFGTPSNSLSAGFCPVPNSYSVGFGGGMIS